MPPSIPETMWAAQITEFNKPYTISTVNVPQLRPNELLVKIHAAGFCHSDIQVLRGELNSPLPLIPSHEPVGTVVQVGKESASKWKVGDRVGILNFKNACGNCAGCRGSRRRYGNMDPRFCDYRETGGFKNDGCFAAYMVADSATTIALPDSVSFEQGAPLLCAGATVWGAINKARPFLQAGDMIGVIGIGGLGQLGVHLQLTDDMPSGLQPDLLINSTHDDASEKILERTGGEGLAAVINCADSIAVNAWSLGLLRTGGVAVLLGLPPEQWRFDTHPIVFRELVLRGSYVASREEVEEMMAVVDQHGVRSQLTVVKKDDILQVPEMYLSRSFRERLVVKFD
ncbi:chaperonin 10-like protein [Aspergillus pseudocaelatus]|uniref:Chaperonin 10-like protein n=1 Tax=Aspergillus pseudocaelatus TaxID=1825620 RepID=A0ABQ6X1D2_9EURO|nr:chaperonin 10-like protein [Aspergillus pseudocaelatus]